MTAVADVLNGAADLIERRGWAQGYSPLRCCALTAILRAADGVSTYDAERALKAEIAPARVITWWNDEPGRTKAEVVAALRAAAENAA